MCVYHCTNIATAMQKLHMKTLSKKRHICIKKFHFFQEIGKIILLVHVRVLYVRPYLQTNTPKYPISISGLYHFITYD